MKRRKGRGGKEEGKRRRVKRGEREKKGIEKKKKMFHRGTNPAEVGQSSNR